MKKLIALSTTFLLILGSLCACTSTTETTAQQDKAPTTVATMATTEATTVPEPNVPERPINFSSATGTLNYVSHELSKDYEGNPALIVYFDYTNNDTAEAHNAMFEFSIVAYQNGISCDTAMIFDGPDALNDSLTDIKGGVTIPVAFDFTLKDGTSEVELEVSELISFEDNAQTMILSLS